jgi:hypothetical protein
MARKQDRPQSEPVVLPGGHEIRATREGQQSGGKGVAALRRSEREHALHVCPECAGEFVQPTDWEPAGRARWRVQLRCPECEWHGSGVHDQRTMDRFDEVLDDGTEALLDDLTHLSRAIMEEEVDRFVDALQRDLVQPEDF